MSSRRVVVTGMGAVSSIGTGLPDYTRALRAGRSGAAPLTAVDTRGFPSVLGCEVKDFRPDQWIRGRSGGRASQFAAAAARMAVTHAGITPEQLRSVPGLVTVGTTSGESQDMDQLARDEVAAGPGGMTPRLAARVDAQNLALEVARELDLSDVEAYTIGTACAAGNYAIGDAVDAVRSGEVDYALCGGSDAVNRALFAGFQRLGLVAPEACRPFDVDRNGTLLGEGAGVLLLESLEAATARGAAVHAEVLGYGLNCDGKHPTSPDRSSIADCMLLALADSGVKPGEVDLILAHGTGTKLNDPVECGAIHDVYGERVPPVVAVKAMLGHTLGAASALSAVASVLAISEGFVPPTINHHRTDPDCAVDCVPNRAVDAEIRVVQNNGFAFGGNNAVVLFGRPGEAS